MFLRPEYRRRLKAAQSALKGSRLDALLVTGDANVRYFTGVSSGRLLVWKNGAKFFLNEVYFGLAKNSPVAPAKQEKDAVKDLIFAKRFKKVGIDEVTLQGYKSLNPRFRKLLRPSDICGELRKIKSKEELRLLSKAGKIAADVMRMLDESKIEGMSEFELAGLIEYEIRKAGSEVPPFGGGMLCMSGPNSAYPHAPVTGRKIRSGDLLILDFGAVVDGYHSDMTRTLEVGKVSKEKHNLVGFVDWLKDEAIDRVEPGGKISKIHKYIEDEIKKKGYTFYHLSGHGVGLDVHEAPSIGPDEKDVFKSGMVFTIEPGIYTTKFGARSEDTIAIIGKKVKVLTA
jgi:Xaa-Pro aminopeptidase